MSSNNVLGPTTRDTTEWNNAWDVVRRLAAARRVALHEMKQTESALAQETAKAPESAGQTVQQSPVADPGQYARAIAEIEQASAALRRAEPALEIWAADAPTYSEPRHPRSVWVLVGGIWISTVLVVASAIGATLYLLG